MSLACTSFFFVKFVYLLCVIYLCASKKNISKYVLIGLFVNL